ncbi:MAG: helix-turn-helix domain-containing protein [Enterococcus sp.]|nr:helix-turn-helix domain-containing protein [Enterococcus sp.]
MNAGSLIRKIRQSKDMSLKSLSSGILSFSTLASFERNETMITFDRLLLILHRLNISLNEFVSELDFPPCDYLTLFNSLQVLIQEKNRSEYCLLIKKLTEEIEHSVDTQKQLNLTMVKVLGERHFQLSGPDQNNIDLFQEYIFSSHRFDHYELTLFGNCYFLFPHSFISNSCHSILKNIKDNPTKKNYRDDFRVILNCILHFIDINQFNSAYQFIQSTNDLIPQKYLYERCYLKAEEIIYNVISKNKYSDKYALEARQLCATINLVGSGSLSKNLEDLFISYKVL